MRGAKLGDYILSPSYLSTPRLLTLYNKPPKLRMGAQDMFRFCIKMELATRGIEVEYVPRSLCGMSVPILVNKAQVEAVCKKRGIDPLFVTLNSAFETLPYSIVAMPNADGGHRLITA